jgi:hypothetical protein
MKTKNKILPMAMLSLMSINAHAYDYLFAFSDGIQIAVNGIANSGPRPLPEDGSSCDPRVIRQNLKLVNESDIFKDLKLTTTVTKGGSCYGPCESDVQEAIKLHCEKGELLAHLVEHIKERVK